MKNNENKTYESRQIYKITKKSKKLKEDIADYITFNGLTSAGFTFSAYCGARTIVDIINEESKNMTTAHAIFTALVTALSVCSLFAHKNYKKKIGNDYKKLTDIVSDEEDYFTEDDAKKLLTINKNINKLAKSSSFIAAIEGLIFSVATCLSVSALDTQNNHSAKTKAIALTVAAFYYLLGGGLAYLNKKNMDQIDYRTGMLTNGLMKPYTTNEMLLKRK